MCRALDLDIAQSISAVAASTGSSRALQMFVESGYVHAFPRHTAGYTHGAALLGKDVDLMDSLLASGAIPPVLNLVARTGLRVAGEAAAVESARFDRPAGRTE